MTSMSASMPSNAALKTKEDVADVNNVEKSFHQIIKKVVLYRKTFDNEEERDEESMTHFMQLLRYSTWWDEEDPELIESLITLVPINTLSMDDSQFFIAVLKSALTDAVYTQCD
jgi:hypothetical protein